MWYKEVGRSFFLFVSNHTFEELTQTDRQRDSILMAIPCIALRSNRRKPHFYCATGNADMV